ncbi:hypothetical protein RND81_08G019600 [Saponaria officinalis]|uniref:UDP N-acetylglucosamine O-acyltransferase C-terminal domain-containing protein n=1 Tax=Saponaria officinalis TaxID=3572 RepID=A0AAW1J3L4_SAPOF
MNILVKARNTKQLSQKLSSFTFQRLHSCAAIDEVSNSIVIHPTAVVHPNASLGHGVSIGPFCTVGSSAKLGNACKLYPGSHIFGNTQLGDYCTLMTGAVVGDELPGKTVIGSNNVIGHHAVVGVRCQDLKYKIGDECFLYVGDNNDIREYSSIHRSSKPDDKTVIGDKNLIMGLCHVAHDCKIGSNNILANNTMLAGHVVLEDYIHTAGAVVVHQHCHLGSYCFVGGGSVISQDVPKFTLVSGERAELRGLNLEGLRRHGFSDTEVNTFLIFKSCKPCVSDICVSHNQVIVSRAAIVMFLGKVNKYNPFVLSIQNYYFM